MSIDARANEIHYQSQRIWPQPAPASTDVRIRIGSVLKPDELSSFDHFLTARWTLFSAHARGLHYADAFHEPWPLQRAEVLAVRQTVFEAAGLSTPVGDAIAHYSRNVEVGIGVPRRVTP